MRPDYGQVPAMAGYLAEQFRVGGVPAEDVHVLPFTVESGEGVAGLVVRYRGDGSSGRPPVRLMAAGIPTYGVMGLFMKGSDIFAHGLNERVPVRAFFGALEYWRTVITQLAGGADHASAVEAAIPMQESAR